MPDRLEWNGRTWTPYEVYMAALFAEQRLARERNEVLALVAQFQIKKAKD